MIEPNPLARREQLAKDARERHENRVNHESEIRELARKLDNPERGPNPVPDKHVRDMTITELELFERWAGISPSSAERARRQRVRARAAEMDQRI